MELKILPTQTKSDHRTYYKYVGIPERMQKLLKEQLDPLDEQNVFVAKSDISGEGLFAKKIIGMGSVIAIYSGIFINSSFVFSDSMVPIIYFFYSRSMSRQKQSFS